MSQNIDCTWSIIDNQGRFLSVVSNFDSSKIWWKLLGNKETRGVTERWYIERSNNHHYIQNACWEHYYITQTTQGHATKSYQGAMKLELVYYACDKNAWWNY